MNLRRCLIPALFVAGLFAVTILRDRPQPGPEIWTFTGPTMGTEFTVKIVATALDNVAVVEIKKAVARALDDVDMKMSTWKRDSELSRFNDADAGKFVVSPELCEVVAEALRVAEASDGAFDMTIGPLVDAWGFGAQQVSGEPSAEQLAVLRKDVGWRRIEVDVQGEMLSKDSAALRLDLSAIAKGFGVDQVVEALKDMGYRNHMVEVGGEVRTSGTRFDGHSWLIGIESPDTRDRTSKRIITVNERALATSGDYHNFRMVEGRRISHTIDPRSGRAIEHHLASVSVIANSCMTADAWATALNVLGQVEGMKVAEREGLAAYFITRDIHAEIDGFVETSSSEWSLTQRPER